METTKVCVRRSVAEKRRIVELTFQPGQSVAPVAQAEGVNSHQVFQWRRACRAGELVDAGEQASSLLPVVVSGARSGGLVERQQTPSQEPSVSSGAIHIELPGRVAITVEHGADRAALQAILTILARNDRLQGNPALESLRNRSSSAPDRGHGSPRA
jgi:transposase